MSIRKNHAKIYKQVVDVLTKSPQYRSALIDLCLKRNKLDENEITNAEAGSIKNNLRSEIGTVINEMHTAGLISIDTKGRYYLVSTKPVAIRIEKCQKEIIKALSCSALTKSEINTKLRSALGTDKTATTKDDDILSTYIGQILKKMLSENVITLIDGAYSLTPQICARIDDVNEILALKSDFISRLHTKGGEFFENYFMTLLKKHSEKNGKKVLECYVNGGSSDGGIDGIIKTEDSLGFRETTMVQTKNRIELTSETDVRGFYGAVCAGKGSRGIFAVTSEFHPSANAFLNSLDNCIGINGDKLFSMAIECSYGVKRKGKTLSLDEKII